MIRRPLVLLASIYLAAKLLPATALVYWPSEVWVEADGDVTVDRTFPGDYLGLPRPRISFIETVDPISPQTHGGQDCEIKGGPDRYDDPAELGRWNIASWAEPCLADPQGYRWSATWTWHIGSFRLGGVELSKTIIKEIEE
ncbi:hypothetical protein [Roseovarius sp. MMSF_3281]|uniref:hypothetical protein n=1 Tax=Roseovarius sp. MMSF_3281 TaxID=3046694 RepID=UPI00273E7838|nr:hypothetical protein [Roseovarius sp. MMSF_3281]